MKTPTLAPVEPAVAANFEAAFDRVDRQLRLQGVALENTPNAVVVTDPQGLILWTNHAFTAITGYTAPEAIGRNPRFLQSGQHDREFYTHLWRTILEGGTWRGEFTNRRKDGSLYFAEHTIVPVRDPAGTISHFVAIMNDVTPRKHAESELRSTHAELEQLREQRPAVTYRMKLLDGAVARLSVSDNVAQLLGFPARVASQYAWWLARLHPADRDRAVASLAATGRETLRTEYRLSHLDGSYRWIEDNRRLVQGAAGQAAELVGLWSDITERKRAEGLIRQASSGQAGSRQRRILRDTALLAVTTAAVLFLTERFDLFESAFYFAGRGHPQISDALGTLCFLGAGLVLFSYRRWRESRAETDVQAQVAEAMRTLHAELELRVQQRTAELADANETLRAEIAERRRAEESLRLFRSLVDHSSDALEVIDPETGRFLDVNDRSCADLGYTRAEHLALRVFDIAPQLDPANWPERMARARGSAGRKNEAIHRRKDGTTFPVEFHATLVRLDREYLVVTVRDISVRKRMEETVRESQALYHSLVDEIPAGIFRKDAAGRYVFVNSRFCELMSLQPGAFIGKLPVAVAGEVASAPAAGASAIARAALIARGTDHHLEIMRTGERIELEEERDFTDGRTVFLHVVKSPVFDALGQVIGSQGILIDITARKRAERELREQREQWEALVTTAADAIFVVQDERFAFANPAAARLFGTPDSSALLGRSVFDFVHEDFHAIVRARIEESQQHDHPLPMLERKVRRLDGRTVEIESGSVGFQFAGRPALLVDARDIGDRKRAERLLRETEAQFRDLAENIHEVFWLTAPNLGEILYVSPGYERIWGRTCASLRESPDTWFESIHPDDRERVTQAVGKMAAGLYDEEYRIIRPDGSMRWIHDRAFPVRSEDGALLRMAGLAEDITQRKRSEARIQLQHAVTQVLADAGSQPRINQRVLETVGRGLDWVVGELWTVDRPAGVLRCTEIWHEPSDEFRAFATASRQLTFSRDAGLPGRVWALGRAEWIPDLSHDSPCPQRTLALQGGLRGWIGFPIKCRNEVLGVIGFYTAQVHEPDAAIIATLATLGCQLGQFVEQQQVAEQFRQAQKMEALGTLAGGVAHDFNNIIAGINGYTELAKMDSTPGTELVGHLDAVLKCSDRAANLVRQILAFSRHEEHERRAIQLRHIVGEALHLLRATIPTTIVFENHLARDLPTVLADANQIHQVVMNLGTNAWHAMRGRTGKLAVVLEPCAVDDAFAEAQPGLRPGPYVRLSIRDTGHGMDPATLARIFDPFFTTKGPGEGTGLGLAVVHGIMQSHEGLVTVHSQPGEGTTFELYFPACDQPEADGSTDATPTPRGHGERVLYVEDEEPLAKMGQCVLERLGYAADYRTDPTAALELVRRDPGRYALVLTDLTMPGLTGTEFAQELLKIRPDLPIVLATGYAATLTIGQVHALGIREFLLKPLSVQTLGLTVARVLAAAKPA